jgi:hypothetical protein
VKLNHNLSASVRVLWSFLLALLLSGTAIGEAYTYRTILIDKDDLEFCDEEGKTEGERAEENENRGEKGAESLFEGGDGDGNNGFGGKKQFCLYSPKHNSIFSDISCSYAYYPHLNKYSAPNAKLLVYPHVSYFLLYHKLVFYELS